MTTLDDKLLGEKLQYYYSTSEDEDSDHEDKDRGRGAPASSCTPAEAELAGEGVSINTAPGLVSVMLALLRSERGDQ